MRTHTSRTIVLGTFLLGTTALVSPAMAQFNNQVNATALTATNNDNVYSNSALGQSQTINSGIINNIGAASTGALGVASVNQTVSQSSINQGGTALPGNQVNVTTISATNNTTGAVVPPASFNVEADVSINGFALIGTTFGAAGGGGGVGNSIGAAATAAAAQANITQSFDSNSATDLTTLPANSVVATTISATNTAGSVLAAIGVSTGAQINDGVGNSISAQALGASANASISTRQLDTATAATTGLSTPATNNVSTGTLTATNNGEVIGTGFNSGVSARIDNGTGNTIGAVAIGASACAASPRSSTSPPRAIRSRSTRCTEIR